MARTFDVVLPKRRVEKDTEVNTAQRASGDFARHLLANFPSEPVSYLPARILRAYFPRYFGKILENPQRIFSVFPFISQKIWRRNLHTSDTKQTLIFHKNAREYIQYSLRFLFHLTKNLTTHLSHNLCAVLPYKKSRLCGQRWLLRNDFSYFFLFFVSCRSSCIRSAKQVTARITAPPTTIQPTTTFRIW